MRFERELDQDSVPEWRVKYLDYKTGKHKIRACVKALEKANKTPRLFPSPASHRSGGLSNHRRTVPTSSLRSRPIKKLNEEHAPAQNVPDHSAAGPSLGAQGHNSEAVKALQTTLNKAEPKGGLAASTETQPLKSPHGADQGSASYGSMGSTPRFGPAVKLRTLETDASDVSDRLAKEDRKDPGGEERDDVRDKYESPKVKKSSSILWKKSPKALPSLKLPEPALASQGNGHEANSGMESVPSKNSGSNDPRSSPTLIPRNSEQIDPVEQPQRIVSTPSSAQNNRPPLIERLLTTYSFRGPPRFGAMEAYREFDACQDEFFRFLEEELKKVEEFYKEKEDDANQRMETLQDQLEVMKSRHSEKLAEQRRKKRGRSDAFFSAANVSDHPAALPSEPHAQPDRWSNDITRKLGLGHARLFRRKKHSGPPHSIEDGKDGRNRQIDGRLVNEVPYKEAKGRLKHALQDFYRNLEMLKSYAMLNRTAFRKINKKYDKALNTRQTGKFMAEKVDQAWFVQSNVLESHLNDVEYLYARHFAKGSHKIAVKKLRTKHQVDYSLSSFRDGLLLGAGVVLAARGLSYASDLLEFGTPTDTLYTTYLLQLYAGYFLALLLFLLFLINCKIWVNQKINYVFIFEFDTRHNLDWRQTAEIPSLLWFLFGLFMWLNFKNSSASPMFIYWPVLLLVVTAAILLLPMPLLYHRSRLWWLISNLRLYSSGYFSVEFRDFLLGDMYCSLAYTLGNAELFFCLYARGWNDPARCNSGSSRLLGFLTTLPGLFRLGQCIRRYHDTRMVFPHVANAFKYLCTVIFYMTLSLYRIQQANYPDPDNGQQSIPNATLTLKAIFVLFATINSIYVTLWDILIDWSLGHFKAEWPLLREPLGFNWPVFYYVAMILDPPLRFNWLPYVLVAGELQHSALLSFFVALTEIFRRSFWSLIRVENEHMTNVGMFRASRDIPLPYNVRDAEESAAEDEEDEEGEERGERAEEERPPRYTEPEAQTDPSLRPMSTPRRLGRALTMAHAHDFERRKPQEMSSDEEDDEDEEDEAEEARQAAEEEEREEIERGVRT